jgi:O-antigen/teichoic acid export membrane protein
VSRELARNAGVALSWRSVQHVGVKLIYLARLLILARLLAPADFGLLAIAVVAVEFLMQLTNIGEIPALVQRADIERSHYDAAWTVGLLRAVGIGAIAVLAAPLIADVFSEPRAVNVIRALALRPVLQAAASIGVARLTRDLQFRTLAILWVVEALASTVVAVALASPLGVWALVAGALAGPAVFSLLSHVVAPHRPRLCFRRNAIVDLVRFGRWVFLTVLMTLAGRSVLQATISRQLGVVELGLYALAARLAFLPAEASAVVLGAVSFPLFSRLQSEAAKTAAAFRTLFSGLCAFVLPVVGLIVALAPSMIDEVLGEKWAGTVPIIRLLAGVSAVGLLGDTARPMFLGMGRPYVVTVLATVQSICVSILVWILAGPYGLVGAAFAWLPAVAASQIVCALFIHRYCPGCFAGLGGPLLAVLSAATAGSLAAFALNSTVGGLLGLVLAGLSGLTLAGGLLLAADRLFGLGLLASLEQVFPRVAALLGHRSARA